VVATAVVAVAMEVVAVATVVAATAAAVDLEVSKQVTLNMERY
jgi:hypothetical protein